MWSNICHKGAKRALRVRPPVKEPLIYQIETNSINRLQFTYFWSHILKRILRLVRHVKNFDKRWIADGNLKQKKISHIIYIVILILPYKNKITTNYKIPYFSFNFDRKSIKEHGILLSPKTILCHYKLLNPPSLNKRCQNFLTSVN